MRAAARVQLKWGQAIADSDRAIKLNPDEPDLLKQADVYRQMGEHEKAIVSYRKAIELNPKYASAHNNLGHALKAQGKLDEAVASFRKAIELNPESALPQLNLLRRPGGAGEVGRGHFLLPQGH